MSRTAYLDFVARGYELMNRILLREVLVDGIPASLPEASRDQQMKARGGHWWVLFEENWYPYPEWDDAAHRALRALELLEASRADAADGEWDRAAAAAFEAGYQFGGAAFERDRQHQQRQAREHGKRGGRPRKADREAVLKDLEKFQRERPNKTAASQAAAQEHNVSLRTVQRLKV